VVFTRCNNLKLIPSLLPAQIFLWQHRSSPIFPEIDCKKNDAILSFTSTLSVFFEQGVIRVCSQRRALILRRMHSPSSTRLSAKISGRLGGRDQIILGLNRDFSCWVKNRCRTGQRSLSSGAYTYSVAQWMKI
jgi:hypothetical protein